MKRPLLSFFLCTALFVFSAPGFSQVFEDKVEYDKKKQQALAINYSYPEEAVENALIARVRKLGYKAKEEKGLFNRDKGFIVFKNAVLEDITNLKMNYVVKIERKSKKDKDETTLYFLINQNDEDAIPSLSKETINNAKAFLTELVPDIEVAYLELQIAAQEETVKKAEEKLSDLQDNQKNLEKKIQNLQEDLEKNGKDQQDQQKEVESQKGILDDLQKKRK